MALYVEQIGSPNSDDITATFDDETGKVVISGTGATKDFTASNSLFWDYKKQIASLIVENGVSRLGNYTFSYWSNCTNFNISNTVKEFGNGCFLRSKIKNFVIESDMIVGTGVFQRSEIETVTVKNGIARIPSEFCNACDKLTTVNLPESITEIGNYGFANCTAIAQIKLPPSIVSLQPSSFVSSRSLETVGIMQNIKGTLSKTFSGCLKLKEAYIPYGITTIDEAFKSCHAVQTVTVPKSVTAIRSYAFGTMNNLEKIYILNPSVSISASSGVTKGGTICNSISNSTADHSKITMYGFSGSTAETYANNNNIPFVPIGELKSISLIKKPDKLVYEVGDLLDLDGFYLQAEYEGASFRIAPDSITGFDSKTLGEKTVSLAYEGFQVEFSVTVSNSKELVNIFVSQSPKTSYVLMDSIDLTGLEITANYSDGSSKAVSDYSISSVDTSSPGTKTITITYESQETSFDITVYDIESIKVDEYFGYNQYFFIGDKNTGDYRYAVKSLIADYENGEKRTIPYGVFTETEVDTSRAGIFYTIVKYLDLELQSQYTVYGNPFVSTAGYPNSSDVTVTLDINTGLCVAEGTGQLGWVSRCPTSYMYKVKTLEVKEGITGLHNANYMSTSNFTLLSLPSTIESITEDDMRSILGTGSISSAIIRINAKKDSVAGSPWGQTNVTIIWTAKPEKLNIVSLPNKTKYSSGEEFDPTGIKCNILYSNGKTYDSDGELSFSKLDTSKKGKATVTVYCTEDGVQLSANFEVEIAAEVVGIRIAHYPTKEYYNVGESLDLSGMQVVKISGTGSETEISDYRVSGFDSSKVGTKTVKVFYDYQPEDTQKTTFRSNFKVKVTSSGSNPFVENTDSINVTVHWINGEFEDLTNENIQNNTLTLQESICSENYFIFGGCVSNQITFQAHHKQFDGTDESYYPRGKIEVYMESQGTKIKIFTGEISSAERASGSLTRNFVAYDYLYNLRNTDITWWCKNQMTDKQMILTQKQFRDALFSYLGIEQIDTVLEYDDAYVPNTNLSNQINAVDIIKDLCLQNSVFGWMNRDGKFEYLRLPENSYQSGTTTSGIKLYSYYDAQLHFDTFKSFSAKEGRIWFPYVFQADPYPGVFYSGEPTAQEAYENNIYMIRNSFFVGNDDWLNYVFDADEYGNYTRMEPIMEICRGTSSKLDIFHLYRAQEYTIEVEGDPLNMVGQSVQLRHVKQLSDGSELEWVVNSYIMSRTLKLGYTKMIDAYSAKNGPYNGNSQQLGKNTPEISATAMQTRSELPVISYADFSDGADFLSTYAADTVKKDNLRCIKRIKKSDYDALVAAGNDRTDTLYFTYEEG